MLLGHDLIHRFAKNALSCSLLVSWPCIPALACCCRWDCTSGCCDPPGGWPSSRSAPRSVSCWAPRCAWRDTVDISNRSRWFVSVTGPPFCSLRSIVPDLLPVWVLVALVPVAFAEPYIRWQRGLAFTVITAGCVLAMGALARFQNIANLGAHTPRGIQSAFFIPALAMLALHLLVIVWNNAAALRTSENMLAERAAELAASRTRLITAADEERRRLERDLHDGAQQHLVALAVLLQLARTAEHDRYQPLLIEASGLLETAIAEIRRLAHGIYPPLLVSGGLAEALPAVAARAPVPVKLNLQGLAATPLRSRPPSISAAAKRCRMPPNTAAPAPPSRSPPMPTTGRLPSRSATPAADSTPRPPAPG